MKYTYIHIDNCNPHIITASWMQTLRSKADHSGLLSATGRKEDKTRVCYRAEVNIKRQYHFIRWAICGFLGFKVPVNLLSASISQFVCLTSTYLCVNMHWERLIASRCNLVGVPWRSVICQMKKESKCSGSCITSGVDAAKSQYTLHSFVFHAAYFFYFLNKC